MDTSKTFHLGLCMAGSISAGAYTAGVMDYLIEALGQWQKAKGTDASVPDHQVVIDLLCGSSGGGMTGAMSFFALMDDKMEHAKLNADGITYTPPVNNVLWNSWVELTGGDVFSELLSTKDIGDYTINSGLNSDFIDKVAGNLQSYVNDLAKRGGSHPPYVGPAPEMFMTLFNITGINYELLTKSSTGANSSKQYVADHRDMAHFRWTDKPYPEKDMKDPDNPKNKDCDGRMPVSLSNLGHLPVVIDAAKATGAFPVGLKARLVSREAKFIWDNPFFSRDGKFDWESIFLGDQLKKNREGIYTSLNADGGTANNEPVELAQNLLLNMRDKIYDDVDLVKEVGEMNKEEKEKAKKEHLINTTVLLIDPFPSTTNEIVAPNERSGILPGYGFSLINAMNSQLIFDAKDALDAYKKENYGLHIISPSKPDTQADLAIACGSLYGFGGFLEREFRVHDFFLGRKNCQSFLRKYFVAKLNETDPEGKACIQVVLDSYNNNPAAKQRFAFKDEMDEEWVPIIPDVSLTKPIELVVVESQYDNKVEATLDYKEDEKLPLYNLKKLPPDFLDKYNEGIAARFMGLSVNLIKTNAFVRFLVRIFAWFKRKSVADMVAAKIAGDFTKRKLM